MKKIGLSIMAMFFVCLSTVVHSQNLVSQQRECSKALSCVLVTNPMRRDGLECIRTRNTLTARVCKTSWLEQKDFMAASIAHQIPLLIFIVVLGYAIKKRKSRRIWFKGMLVGAVYASFILFLDSYNHPYAEFFNPYLWYFAFPSTGLLSFSPHILHIFSFDSVFILVNMILFSGAYGFYKTPDRGVETHTTVFVLTALGLSIFELFIV